MGCFTFHNREIIGYYEDDTAIFYEADTWQELKEKLETDINAIKKWLDYKLLTINLIKTKFLPFSRNGGGITDFQ